eukprot:scaffold13060_cov119-Isochrysis_galbana.AAC.1
MLAILARQVTRIRAKSLSPTRPRPFSRAWFSPSSMRCLRPCTPPVRLFSVYSIHVQPSIRHRCVRRRGSPLAFARPRRGGIHLYGGDGATAAPASGNAGGGGWPLPRGDDLTAVAVAASAADAGAAMWEYELYGGAQLAPHRLYVLARLLTPPKGVWEGPRAIVHLPRNTRCRFLSPPPCAFLASPPRAWEVCLFLC